MRYPELPDRLRTAVAQARIARLATITAEGRPHVVPVCFALEHDLTYVAVDHKPKSTARLQRLDNVRRNPLAELLVDHYEEDWTRLWWVRARAEAVILDASAGDAAEVADALNRLVGKYPQYQADPPDGPVIRLRVTTWLGWSATPS